MLTIADLQKGEKAIILDFPLDTIPLKLIEMGCLPGNEVMLIQTTLFNGPLFLTINGSNIAVRKDTASQILIDKIV
ncbi:ferrous iron transport protein A [Kordia sp. YSTF-M3]|uniref:Ferrous iron transport protein A n=1 Tax=Kordia aestuariivivens TaxID=2759037 RepID=A0ABR7Q6U9_9FLAO|nr:FeoA family protein [Kordia aestuariivivens]MBC8754287.1 ferrous iron transport protein A [Kordia aestuariivivens]